MLSLADLIKKSTRDQALDTLLSIGVGIGLAVTSWQSGQPTKEILTTMAQKISEFSETMIEIAKGGFGDLASGDWVPLWAKATYDVDLVEASPATGTSVKFTNASATSYGPIPIGGQIIANTITGKTYRNTAAITIPASSTLENVAVQCDFTGTQGNAAPGDISTMVTTRIGVTVTNVEAVLGADQETATALVARTRRKLASLSPNGPKDAYNYVVTTPALCATSTPITRARTVANATTGAVTVYLATASGAPISGDVTIANATIYKYAEPWCVTATGVAASPVVLAITYQVYLTSNLDDVTIKATIAAALAVFFSAFPIGGTIIAPASFGSVDVDAIRQVIGTAVPGIVKVTITLPAADTVLALNEFPELGTITPTVTRL